MTATNRDNHLILLISSIIKNHTVEVKEDNNKLYLLIDNKPFSVCTEIIPGTSISNMLIKFCGKMSKVNADSKLEVITQYIDKILSENKNE